MENQGLKQEDLRIDSLGEAKIASPLGLNTLADDGTANYISDARSVLYDSEIGRASCRERVFSCV